MLGEVIELGKIPTSRRITPTDEVEHCSHGERK